MFAALTNDVDDRPLDHTTARVVVELAGTLLPRLEEIIVAELGKAVEALPDRTNRGVEETMAALARLTKASDEIAASLDTAEESVRNVSNGVLPAFSNICEQLDSFAARSASSVEAAGAKGLQALREAMANWEGVLKADGRAQTRELSEFSSELSDLTRGLESILPQAVRDAVEKAMTIRQGEWEKAMLEQKQTLENKLARIEKTQKMLAIGWSIVVCLAAALTLYLRVVP
jgi:ABC-type transporter Mla subunit MlaD